MAMPSVIDRIATSSVNSVNNMTCETSAPSSATFIFRQDHETCLPNFHMPNSSHDFFLWLIVKGHGYPFCVISKTTIQLPSCHPSSLQRKINQFQLTANSVLVLTICSTASRFLPQTYKYCATEKWHNVIVIMEWISEDLTRHIIIQDCSLA